MIFWGIPEALPIFDIWENALVGVIWGSRPDAESDAGLGWKNFGESNSCAMSCEPTAFPLRVTILPFDWNGNWD
jgi:hypothetical protein